MGVTLQQESSNSGSFLCGVCMFRLIGNYKLVLGVRVNDVQSPADSSTLLGTKWIRC